MKLFKSDFDKLYEDLSILNENIEDDTNTIINIKGQTCEFATPFLPVDRLYTNEFARPGIYIWRQKSSNAYYVGQAVNIQDRTKAHSRTPIHDSKKLHNAIKTYGIDDFEVAVIEFCSSSKAELNQLERKWIKKLNTFWDRHDHNLTPGGEGGKSGTLTFEDFKVLVEQLQTTGPDSLTFEELDNYWNFKQSNVSNINRGEYEYIRKYAEILGISFPIRSREDTERIAREHGKEKNPQYKTWNLVVTYAHINSDGKYELISSEILGTFRGHSEAWDTICDIERTKYGTSEEDIIKTYNTFNRKGKKGAACFDELAFRKYARKYTLELIE